MSHFTLDQMLEKSRAVNAVERLAEAEELLRRYDHIARECEPIASALDAKTRAFLAARSHT